MFSGSITGAGSRVGVRLENDELSGHSVSVTSKVVVAVVVTVAVDTSGGSTAGGTEAAGGGRDTFGGACMGGAEAGIGTGIGRGTIGGSDKICVCVCVCVMPGMELGQVLPWTKIVVVIVGVVVQVESTCPIVECAICTGVVATDCLTVEKLVCKSVGTTNWAEDA